MFKWPEQASTLNHIQTREAEAEGGSHVLSPETVDKLKQLGIYRDSGHSDVNSNLKGGFDKDSKLTLLMKRSKHLTVIIGLSLKIKCKKIAD